MQLSSGTVKDYMAEPPSSPDPERVPIEEAHRRGVLDPMTAAIIRVPGNGDTFVPQACNRKLAIFDGRMRYDLQLAYKRLDRVRSEKGYQGTVVVCAVSFAPVAGHIPSRPVIKYMAQLRQTEMWLAPIAGTRLDGAVSGVAADAAGAGGAGGDAIRYGGAVAAPDADQRPAAVTRGGWVNFGLGRVGLDRG